MSHQVRPWKSVPLDVVSLDDAQVPGWIWELRFWLGQLFFWCTLTLLQYILVFQSYAPESDTRQRWTIMLVRASVSLPMTLCLRRAFRFIASLQCGWTYKIGGGVVCVVMAAMSDTLIFITIVNLFLSNYFSLLKTALVVPYLIFFYRLLTLIVWSLLYIGFILRIQLQSADQRIVQAELSLRQSELIRLQVQLQPHFLFNALTCILACRHDPDAVERVTIGLAEHLRFCMQHQTGFSALSKELTALERYLDVERMRFGERLVCRISCTTEARNTVVPPMVLTPLLENALKHGMQTSADKLEIDIDCQVKDHDLVISVRNSGHWIPPEQSGRRGVGLENLRGRMELLKINNFVLDYSTEGDFVMARIHLPIDAEASQPKRI